MRYQVFRMAFLAVCLILIELTSTVAAPAPVPKCVNDCRQRKQFWDGLNSSCTEYWHDDCIDCINDDDLCYIKVTDNYQPVCTADPTQYQYIKNAPGCKSGCPTAKGFSDATGGIVMGTWRYTGFRAVCLAQPILPPVPPPEDPPPGSYAPDTTSSLSVDQQYTTAGTPVTFTAMVSKSGSGPAPTGTVTFYDGSLSLGSVAVSASMTMGSQAVLTTSTLSVGTHTITAVYGGDANYSGSTSNAITEVVQ